MKKKTQDYLVVFGMIPLIPASVLNSKQSQEREPGSVTRDAESEVPGPQQCKGEGG